MSWTIDTTRIFTQQYDEAFKQIIARLQPLSGGTRLQIFGHETETVKLTAYIVGNTDKDALATMTADGTKHLLTTPYTSGYFYVNSINPKLTRSICQSLRTDLASDSPVYLVDIELYYDEY